MAIRPMSRGRVWLVQGLLAAIVALTAVSFVRAKPFWPVSHYPMFSHVRARGEATALEVYVVGAGGEALLPREGATFSRDFDAVGVRAVLSDIAAKDGPASEKSRRFLALLLAELQDAAHRREGDVPAGVRLYRVVWRYDGARDPRRRAAERTLLAEATDAAAP